MMEGNGTVVGREREACPPLAVLLRMREDEGSAREQRTAAGHLWRCERCRKRVEALDALAAECTAAFAIDESGNDHVHQFTEGLHRHVRSVQALTRPSPSWTWAAALMAAFVVGIFISQFPTTIVRAEELLDRAARFEQASGGHSRPSKRLQLRWTPAPVVPLGQVVYPAVSTIRLMSNGQLAATWAEPATLRMLASHGVDWKQPLSIDAIRRWRLRLSERNERVSAAGGVLTLRIQTKESPLRLVELAVRSDTYEVIREAFVVNGLGRLDVETLGDVASPAAPSPPPPLEAAVEAPSPNAVGRDALELAELRARHALHATRLDLGGQVRVAITARQRVLVDGVASPQAGRALNARLSKEPHLDVALRLGNVAATEAPVLTPHPRAPIGEWLDNTFRDTDAAAKANFLPELGSAIALAARQLDALAVLERRYPSALAPAMSRNARGSLRALVNEHYRDLNETLNRLAEKTAVLQGSPSDLPVALVLAPPDWSARIPRAATEAETLQRLFPSLVRLNDRKEVDASRAAFDAAFRRLWFVINSPSPRR